MKWAEAVKQIDKPSFTNREASGLLKFSRSAFVTYSKTVALTPIDWYAYALPALGWFKAGDKFKVDTAHQLQPYPATAQLRAALATLATELDAQGVPFKLLVDPRGTAETYRELASSAWVAMQQEAKGEGHAATELPGGGFASEQNPFEVVATAAKKKKPPVQLELPEEGGGKVPTKKNGGGGAFVLLALLAFGSKRRKRGR